MEIADILLNRYPAGSRMAAQLGSVIDRCFRVWEMIDDAIYAREEEEFEDIRFLDLLASKTAPYLKRPADRPSTHNFDRHGYY